MAPAVLLFVVAWSLDSGSIAPEGIEGEIICSHQSDSFLHEESYTLDLIRPPTFDFQKPALQDAKWQCQPQ